jgi:hypothetical protein
MASITSVPKKLSDEQQELIDRLLKIKTALQSNDCEEDWDVLTKLAKRVKSIVNKVDNLEWDIEDEDEDDPSFYLVEVYEDIKETDIAYLERPDRLAAYVAPTRESEMSDEEYANVLKESMREVDECFWYRQSAIDGIDAFVKLVTS